MEQMLIDGKLVEAESGKRYDNVDPATGQVIGDAPDAAADDAVAAVAAARRSFDTTTWSTDHELRARCLDQLTRAMTSSSQSLREVMVAEAGVPISLTYGLWLDAVVERLSYWSDLALTYDYERAMPLADGPLGSGRRRIVHEPVGVVSAITPWNYTIPSNVSKLYPALAAGCTVVLKAAPDTPWSATRLAKLIAESTDFPPGVVNIITSSDHLVGEALTTDERVDMVNFTGSTATGKRIMSKAADTVKRVALELGGKSAHVVLDDADFDAVVGAAGGMCVHAGQGCAIPTRMLLPRSRYAEAVEIAAESFRNVAIGSPTDPQTLCGPLISARQRERVLGYLDTGRREARLIIGGGTPAHLPEGFYVEPTLFADVDPDAVVAQEEIFGPVLVLIPYDDDDDAVRIANHSRYGLSGAVSGGDPDRALAVARRIRTGTVSVNGAPWWGVDSPFGGYRHSGIGREQGVEGFAEHLETKTIGLPA